MVIKKILRLVGIVVLALSTSVSALSQSKTAQQQTQVIAHRGYWTAMKPQSQNSRGSMLQAMSHNFYGTEIDVWLTTDDTLMVNHDEELGGVVIEKSTAADCRSVYLHNGETMPRLEDLLQILEKSTSPTLLIIEIKTHEDPIRGRMAARKTVELVRQHGLQDRVEYIAFSFDICKELHRCDAQAKVAYLNSDIAPKGVYDAGLTGIDYDYEVIQKHPEWVAEAHALGLTVNVWTVDNDNDISHMAALGVDYITTNQPERATQLCR